jgi:hypothetical protein
MEEEQKDFGAFLDRLRFAKDKSEFDQFMAERRTFLAATFLAATFPGRDVSWPHWGATLGLDGGDGEGLRRIVSLRSGCITPHRHQLSDTPGDLIGCLAYRLIWRSDSRVSAVVLGAMRTGEWRWQPSGG